MKITIEQDPNCKYIGEDIMELCGMLPVWVLDHSFIANNIRLKDTMEALYGYGPLLEITPGTVGEDHVYRYPGDSPLHPYLTIQRGDELFIQYPYGIVAFINEAGTFVTRMD